jgi:very-short-patch-repair endonuclease
MWLAATLACGRHAVLSHSSAAALWGIRDPGPGAPIEVTVPPAGVRPRQGLQVHRAALSSGDLTVRRGVPVVKPALMLLGQAAVLSKRQLERDINVADALGLINPDQLRVAAERFAGRAGVSALRAVLDQHTFTLTDSELERMFLPIARRAGIGRPLTRRRVNGFRVDFFWPSLGLVVETDGLRYHRTPAQQARDLLREQTHKAARLESMRFTHWQVAHENGWVERTLRRVAARLKS